MQFENWFDIFMDKIRQLGWDGPIDTDSARVDYENDMSPEEAARSLYAELTSD